MPDATPPIRVVSDASPRYLNYAAAYLDYMSFSRDGLVEQLQFEDSPTSRRRTE